MQQGSASCQLQAELQRTWAQEGGIAWNSAKRTLNEAGTQHCPNEFRGSEHIYICIYMYIPHIFN